MNRATRFAAIAALLPAGVASAATLIHAGRLIDGVSDLPRERVTVVVEEGRIKTIEPGFRTPVAGDEVVDLPASWTCTYT